MVDEISAKAEKSKKSEIHASKLMGTKTVITIQQGTRIHVAAQTLLTHRISGAPVVDSRGQIVGVITEHDLLLQVATKDVVQPIDYTKNVVSVQLDTPLKDIIVIFYKTHMKWVPVIDNKNYVVGVITRLDVLGALLDQGKK